jgi:tetratricopeptide (TPR) repeat protein
LGVLSLIALAVVSTIFAIQESNNAAALTALNTQLEDRSASLEYHGRATIDLAIGWAVLQLQQDEPIQPSELRQLRKALDLLADAPPEFLSLNSLRVLVGALHQVFPRKAFTSVDASEKEQILQQTITLWQRFLSINPEPGAHHEVANAYYWLGMFYRDTGQALKQREAWLKAAAISEATDASSSPDLQRYAANLGRTYYNLGVLALSENRDSEAIDSMTRAIAVLRPLFAANPVEPTEWFLRESYAGRASVLLRQKRYEEALRDSQDALALARQERRQEILLHGLAPALAARGEYETALKEGEAAVSSLGRSGPNLFTLAELYSMAAQNDAQHIARAIALLREAHVGGFFQDPTARQQLRNSKMLGPATRSQPEFRKLLEELGESTSPPQVPNP